RLEPPRNDRHRTLPAPSQGRQAPRAPRHLPLGAHRVAGHRRRLRERRRRLRLEALPRPRARRPDLRPSAPRAHGRRRRAMSPAGRNGQSPAGGAGRFIAVGGGRGGVGKSLVSVNLAVYFAQLGKTVVLVDADAGGSNLHAHFGLAAARAEPDFVGGGADAVRAALVATSVPGLWLLPAAHDAVAPARALRGARKVRWLAALRALPAEYLVVDVGSGQSDLSLDLMLAADIPIAVTVPEPPAIETTYRFLRATYRRRLRRAIQRDRLRSAILDRALADLGALPRPIEIIQKVAKNDKVLAEIAWAEAQAMRVQLVVNQTRVRTDTELGAWMSGLVSRHYGVALDELGHVEHDDTVWLTVRRN